MEKLTAEMKDLGDEEVEQMKAYIPMMSMLCHAAGWGVERDEEKAVVMFRKFYADVREAGLHVDPTAEEVLTDAEVYKQIASFLDSFGAEKEAKVWMKKAVKAGAGFSFFETLGMMCGASAEKGPANLLQGIRWSATFGELDFDIFEVYRPGLRSL